MGCCSSRGVGSELWGDLAVLTPGVFRVTSATSPALREAVDVVTGAFSGTATTQPELGFDWCLGDRCAGKWEDPFRIASIRWIVRLVHLMTFRAGPEQAVLCAREPGSDAIAAVAVVHHCASPPSELGVWWRAMRTVLCTDIGDPPWMKDKRIAARMESNDSEIARMHVKHTKSSKRHIYVQMLGVRPKSQGKKMASLLMRAVNAAADRIGVPCYLETSGARNVEVYRRFGYEPVERVRLVDPAGGASFDEFYALVRPPTNREHPWSASSSD